VARFNGTFQSSAAIANNTAFLWLGYNSTVVCKLRHLNYGVLNAGGTITSEQVAIGLNVTSSGASTPVTQALNKMDSGSQAANNTLVTSWTTPPTLAGNDSWLIPGNDQIFMDQLWEMLSEFRIGAGASNGIAFVNRSGAALPGGHLFAVSVEIEE